MNRTVKVTGFSLWPSTVRKLSHLFSRVGQVQKVYFSPDKNAAFIRFEYRSALDFVLDQEWSIGRETLRVRPLVSDKESSPVGPPVFEPDRWSCRKTESSLYCYSDYQSTRNQLWMDFPHERFGTGPCKKRARKKRKNGERLCTLGLQAGNHCKKLKKKHKRKKKRGYLEAAASVPFGVNASVSKVTRQVFLRGQTTTSLSVPLTAMAKDLLALVSEVTKVPMHLLHITVEGRALTEEVMRDVQDGSTLHYTVKGLGGANKGEAEELKKKAEELKNDGNKMYSEEEYEAAIALYSVSIRKFPLISAYNNRAQCYLLLSKWEESIRDCDQILEQEPENMEALLRRGNARRSKGELDRARRDLTIVCEKGPSSLAQSAGSILQEIDAEQSQQRPASDKEQPTTDRADQELSKSARKRLKKKAQKKNQEKVHEGAQEKTGAEDMGPEMGASVTAGVKQTAGGGDQASAASQAATTSGAGQEQVTNSGDASLHVQSLSGPTAGQTVAPSSSAEEVTHWLQITCGLKEHYLSYLKGLNGEVLFDYAHNHALLVSHTGVPIGVARKVLFLRDDPNRRSRMLTWDAKKVVEFVSEFNPGQDWSKVEENQIDGPAFLSYKAVEEIAQDFKVKQMIAFQIFRGRQNILDEEENHKEDRKLGDGGHPLQQHEENCERCGELQDTASPVLCPTDTEGQSARPVALKEGDRFARYKLYLQNTLHLQPLDTSPGSQNLRKCDLRVIYHKRKDLNKLEEHFMFLILCKPEFCTGKSAKDAYKKLWKLITEKVPSTWARLLPEGILKMFTFEAGTVLSDGRAISFEKESAKLSNIIEFDTTVRKLDQCSLPIMIIDRELLMKEAHGYTLNLKLAKTNISFPFGFHGNWPYWLFDSSDFGWGFRRQTVDGSMLGSLPKCRFRDGSDTKASNNVEGEGERVCPAGDEQHDQKSCEQVSPPGVLPVNANVDMSSSQTDEGFQEEEPGSDLSGQDQAKAENESDQEPEPVKYIRPRPFAKEKWKYGQGVLRAVESGDSMLSRAVEFKFHGNCPPESPMALRSFLYKSLEFVCACLNARKNGTIYFGVAEKSMGEQIFRYGEIHGIEMDQKLCSQYYDVFYSEFIQKCFTSYFELVKLCIIKPHFIPIENSAKYVIEIDVKPSYEQTRQRLFCFDPEPIFQKYGSPTKSEKTAPGKKKEKHVYLKNKDNWTGIFRRDGSETKYLDETQRWNFEITLLPELSEKRNQEELSEAQARRVDMNSPEAEKLKQFIAECDTSMFPILLLPRLSEEEKIKNLDSFEFLHYIRWSAVFDFDDDSDRNGIYSIAKCTNLAFEVHESVVSDFKDMSVEDRKDSLFFPKKTVWLFTNGKTTGYNTFGRLEQKEWKNLYWTYLQNAVHFYKDNSVIPPVRRLVLIMINEIDAGIMEASQDIKTAFNWSCVFFVFQSEAVRQRFAEEMSDDIYEHSVVMPWHHVHHVICQCLKLKSHDEDKYVCASSGAAVPIPFNEWQSWGDLDVLNVRECRAEWDASTATQRTLKAKEEEKNFYQGKRVSWWNLFFTDFHYNHVMKRTIFSKLISHVEDKINTEKDSDRTPTVTISHMPGAGGTTLAKSLLWRLKDRFKCAVLKRITADTERQVTQFWESLEEGQDQTQLCPVVLLADNLGSESSLLNASELGRRLYRRQKEMQLVHPLAVLIHCNRTMKLEGKFQLPQKLTEEEEVWMEKKYEDLEEQHPGGVGTFIALLAMRHGFDQIFLQDVIVQYLDKNVLYENERKLIEYVSLISTYFPSSAGFPGLPVTIFDGLMRNFKDEVARKLPWEKTLSKVAGVILIIEYCYDWESPRNIVRIANQPYAKVILQTSLRKNSETLGEMVLRCLKSPLVSNTSRSSKEITGLLTQMIIERHFDELSQTMTHMSPLIMDIAKIDFNKAVEVLQVGYTTLKNEAFYQQLARLYMSTDLDEAQKYAQLAVQLSPEKRDFKHTLGVVYLRKFTGLKQTRGNVDSISEPLMVANLALRNFIEAQGKPDDDTISLCFAYVQTIETVNKILQFLLDLTAVGRMWKLGLYLTEDDYYDCELFSDLQETECRAVKELIKEGIKALRFILYAVYSNKYWKSDTSFQFSKDKRALDHVSQWCDTQMSILANCIGKLRLQTISTSAYENTPKEDNLLRFKNIKLKGCFFESIFLQVKTLHSTRSENKRNEVKQNLLEIKKNLEAIHEKSFTDMDNLMTVYLARQIAGIERSFTSNKSKIYGFCNKIIQSDLDASDTRNMRSHLYRVLVSWPQNYWEGFHKEEFRRSFQHKSPPLMQKKEPLLPKVHFYITKESAGFHVCHWTEIYDDAEKELPPPDVMSHRLKTFTGDYKIRKNHRGEQFSSIEMKWKCPAGELHLTIWKIRGVKVFREERVEFYLGLSLHGPVAIIHRILPDHLESVV